MLSMAFFIVFFAAIMSLLSSPMTFILNELLSISTISFFG